MPTNVFPQAETQFINNFVKILLRDVIYNNRHWWIANRGSDLHEMNVSDASGMINELRILGNDKASLILTENKGFRQPGNRRHPHSWSIANPAELADWLLKQK